jgi:hypothetical protein
LLKQALTGLGKALVVVLGIGYGVARAFDVFSPDSLSEDFMPKPAGDPGSGPQDEANTENPKPGCHTTAAEATIQRFDRVEERLTHLENSVEALTASVGHAPNHGSARTSEHFVTRAELSAAIEQLAGTMDTDIQRRFDIQNRSVQSLRTMVARTDELLEQVLETIESTGIPA